MPAARGVKRAAAKADPKAAAGPSKLKRKNAAAAKAVEEPAALTKLGEVFTCGQGDVGQLGLGEDSVEKSRFTVVSALGSAIVDICAGGMHTVCIDRKGDVWTFGCNDEGALGRNTAEGNTNEWIPGKVKLPGKVIKISAGDSHTAALLQNGQVYAWGSFRDSHGNMGLTMKGNERVPVEMLPGHKVIQIASGGDHLAMLTESGQIYTCGCAEQGQLGRVTARSCDRHSRLGLNPLLIPAPLQFRASAKIEFDMLWAGTHCTFARASNKGDVYVWGLNNYQQIGARKGKPQTVFTPVISEAFSALKEVKWTKIIGGAHHTIALDADGVCYALGRREYGRLGLGEGCEDAIDLTPIPSLKDKKCINIACGTAASFAVTDNGDVYAWGMGTSGQLGTGKEEDEAEPHLLRSKQLEGRSGLNISAGGQHTVLLVASLKQEEDISDHETASSDPQTTSKEDEETGVDKEKVKADKVEEMEVDSVEAEPKKEEKPKKAVGRRGRKASVSSTASTESSKATKSSKTKQNGGLATVEEAEDKKEEEKAQTGGTQEEEKPSQKSSTNQKSKREQSEDEEPELKRLKVNTEGTTDKQEETDNKMEVDVEEIPATVVAETAEIDSKEKKSDATPEIERKNEVLSNGNEEPSIADELPESDKVNAVESMPMEEAAVDKKCVPSEVQADEKTEGDVTKSEVDAVS